MDNGEETLLLGNESPLGGNLYFQRQNHPSVMMTAASISQFEKSVYNFRDKTLLKFSTGAIKQIQILRKNNPLEFNKIGEVWEISGTMKDMDATDLNAEKFMSDYNEGKLVMPDGTKFGIKPIEEYDSYEGLSPKFKSKITKYYNSSKQLTEGNLMKQFSALSKSHNKMRLNKLSLNVSQEVLNIVGEDKNWTKEAPMADYLKTFLADAGSEFDEGMHRERYKKYIFNKIREGYKDIPNSGPMGSKPEDIGRKTGLTDDAKKRIDIALERLSDRVFDAVENSAIDFTEANTIINANMQQILLQEFTNHANQNEAAAIDKARTTGYRYTREYDGQGGLQTVEYILEPATLNKYITAYDKKDKTPKQDLVYEALQVIELTNTDGDFDLSTKLNLIQRNPKFGENTAN